MAATLAVTVKHLDAADVTALHCHYDGQHQAQGAFVELDTEDGELAADYDGEIGGGIPARVYHRRTLRWAIPVLTAESANELLDELAPLAARVLAGADVEWDGNNHVGVLDADAQDAADEIAARCERLLEEPFYASYTALGETDAYDWFDCAATTAADLGITAETTDEKLAELAAAEEREVLTAQEPAVLTGALEYLAGVRDDLRDEN